MRFWPIAVAFSLMTLSGHAFADDATDAAMWTSVRDSNDAAQFAAYLDAFPRGQFAPLAKIRLDHLPGSSEPGAAQTEPVGNQQLASIKPVQAKFRAVDRLGVDIDARSLRRGSNWRIIAVPQGTPDDITDPDSFAATSQTIKATKARLTIPPGPAGSDEIRVYYIPEGESNFVVAGRAAIVVQPGAPGAIIVNDLINEADQIGAVNFEAKYRDITIAVEGEALRLETHTTGAYWDDLRYVEPTIPVNFVAFYIGHLGTPENQNRADVVCLLPADDTALLSTLGAVQTGDDIVVSGIASAWNGEIVLNHCALSS